MNGLPEYGTPSMQIPLPAGNTRTDKPARSFPVPRQPIGRRTFKNRGARPKDARPGGRTSGNGR